jgi:hypothetical protein
VRLRLRGWAAAAIARRPSLCVKARSRIGRPVVAAGVLHTRPRQRRRDARMQLLVAITDEHIFVLEYRARMLSVTVGRVLEDLPRAGVVAQWQQRRLIPGVRVELSWPHEHVFLTGTLRPGPDTDALLGQLASDEFTEL